MLKWKCHFSPPDKPLLTSGRLILQKGLYSHYGVLFVNLSLNRDTSEMVVLSSCSLHSEFDKKDQLLCKNIISLSVKMIFTVYKEKKTQQKPIFVNIITLMT